MIENAKLDRLLTQVNCRITSIARLRDAGAISERKAEQELKQAVELRAKLCGRSTAKILPLTPKYLEARAHTEGTEKLRRKSAASVMNIIRYAYLDGKPVRLNDREAWWLVDGVWKALHPADAGHDAKLISEEQFNSMFPSLPQLPSTAFQRHLE